ncbi:hypothetical protein HOLleu_00065 [Holothuria leucospilota]|uniref:G-protein coupled receptors family 1 profile domain-containing protein n=1 Tax=Holothuria leucospilota TaxID=206669 RepID=A0A9Q1CMH4_HOLLE|nr:hypothetical protein HOLleu_00065 [Holothuria leucospilota]
MLPNGFLRALLWLVGSVSLLANLTVILGRIKSKNHYLERVSLVTTTNKSQNLYLLNLAIADFLMGVYLFAIGIADANFSTTYSASFKWRKGIPCKIIGFIGVVSNVASLLILSLISLERFFAIVLPFCRRRFGSKLTKSTCAVVWVISAVMALTPMILSDHVEGVFGFSDICSGLPFVTIPIKEYSEGVPNHEERLQNGTTGSQDVLESQWLYSQILYIYFSAACVLVVTMCYVSMFVSVIVTRRLAQRHASNAMEIKMATKMSIIVGTDVFCWVPIIIAGLLTQSGVKMTVDMYAWAVIVAMPINSALNPFIYTISLMKKKEKNKPSFVSN